MLRRLVTGAGGVQASGGVGRSRYVFFVCDLSLPLFKNSRYQIAFERTDHQLRRAFELTPQTPTSTSTNHSIDQPLTFYDTPLTPLLQWRTACDLYKRKLTSTTAPISDDESDGPDAIPAKGKIPTKADVAAAEEEEEDDDEEDADGEEYKVERILGHKHMKGVLHYRIKWLGYDDEADQTWEPIEHLDNAMGIVAEYHDTIGGPPASSSQKKGGKRSASAANLDSPAVKPSAKKKGRQSETNGVTTAKLPEGSWESHVLRVHTVLEESKPSTKPAKGTKDIRTLLGLIEWNDGTKTQHPLAVLRRKCPQKMLDYYEQHLVFRPTTATDDEDADAAVVKGEDL
ncbi:uncharacterized protein LTR77_007694 [Saxophila tyrrhenica]|uniref:Chromo domain-containing protein n=1 Tax=Saxophila tyrrhenica TaxID=1690608 RepID=A0AAV9P3B6_9PEZI|nr:hypothetical protein LTR77_007694 [Saxophila tyrrhenica]